MDTFGRQLASTGTTPNPYRYGGAWGYITDPSGLLQLGARFYWPEVGRFVQQDPIRDDMSLYAYADDNPVVWDDADGMAAGQSLHGQQCHNRGQGHGGAGLGGSGSGGSSGGGGDGIGSGGAGSSPKPKPKPKPKPRSPDCEKCDRGWIGSLEDADTAAKAGTGAGLAASRHPGAMVGQAIAGWAIARGLKRGLEDYQRCCKDHKCKPLTGSELASRYGGK